MSPSLKNQIVKPPNLGILGTNGLAIDLAWKNVGLYILNWDLPRPSLCPVSRKYFLDTRLINYSLEKLDSCFF